jgi:hypothetical protein
MATTLLTSTFYAPALPIDLQSESLTLGQALDGDREAVHRIVSGGPDAVQTAVITAADTTNFDFALASLLGAAPSSGVTRFSVLVKTFVGAAAVANAAYWETAATFADIAGTMTIVGAQTDLVAHEGTAATNPAVTISTTNLRVAVVHTGAVDHNTRVEVYVRRWA